MLQLLKRFSWLGLLALSPQLASGFALLGPNNEAYQVPTIGYNPLRNYPGDLLPTAPKNLNEEYRRNTPVMYYASDANFNDYFGSRGMLEIDKAFAVFNSLTNVSSYSDDLSEFPLNSRRVNYRAESLFLYDIKSVTMTMIIENLGLAEPVRYVWDLHDRFLPPGAACPDEEYWVVKRNYDPVFGTSVDQPKYSSYVNNVLYTYQIPEYCSAPLPPQAYAQPFSTDPDADEFTAVASTVGSGNVNFFFDPWGAFYTGLTRDDVGGLRYLLRSRNMNVESIGPNALAEVTNYTPQVIFTSNLTQFADQALTNNAATLAGLYPGLTVLGSSNFFVNVYTTNFTPYFTNYPWDPLGAPAHLAFATNVTASVATHYVHSFANVLQVTNVAGGWKTLPLITIPPISNRVWVTIETTSVGVTNFPWAPAGSTNFVLTNVSDLTFQTNAILGDFIILPTNLCQVAIIASQLTNVVTATNAISIATNLLVNPNPAGNPVGTPLSFSQNLITYFTNHAFVIYPITCESSNIVLRQGIERIQFVRRDFDSLLTRYFFPITNDYTMTVVTNGVAVSERVHRTVLFPDFLFSAQDMTAGPGGQLDLNLWARSITFNTNTVGPNYPGLAGPGTIESPTAPSSPTFSGAPGTLFTFNKVGPLYLNPLSTNFVHIATNAWLSELTQSFPFATWGSFDATTNTPVVYPNDVSIGDLENQVLIQVSPQYLPDGGVGTPYYATLQTHGSTPAWQGPFYWSLSPSSAGLPPGLFIATAGDGTGLIYGTPTQAGFYDFSIRVTDSQGHIVDKSNAIKINP